MRISDWSSDVCSSDLVETLEQQVATLKRSDQISRDANRDLQGTLAERDEEIAGLRADVAFYERFVGATGQRRGLTVHQLHLQPQRSEEHTSELQSLMRISYAVFCLKKKNSQQKYAQ